MSGSIELRIDTVKAWCRGVLERWVEDEFIISTWVEVALGRDLIGDFPRGTPRLESIVDRLKQGVLSRKLELAIEHPTPISARVWSTYRNWPDEVARKGAELAVRLAEEHGIGAVAFPKPNIVGEALKPVWSAGLIGLLLTQNAPLLNMGVSKENLIGNNPLAICAPGEPPFLFDGSFGAYSRHSFVSLKEHADREGELPPGIVLDKRGNPARDADILNGILSGDRSNGSFAPLGGMKGLGMAMGMEMIAGALTGGFFGEAPGKPWGEGAVVMAFSPKLFGAAGMVERARSYLQRFDGYPGQHSFAIRKAAMERGELAYPAESFESLKRAGVKSGVEWRG